MNTTPEEKAKELIKKFQVYLPLMLHKEKTNPQVKEYAIIAVDEILFANGSNGCQWAPSLDEFWKEVKEHIQNLK